MKPLHSSTRIEDYLADDEDNSTSNKVRDAYKNRFINIFNIFRDIHEPSGNEETELKKSAMISEAIKDKVLEELTASKKPAYEFISIDNELYIKADREPARTSILEAEKNESSLSVPAIVELSLNEKISSKQQLEDILTGNFDFTSQDIEKACTALDFAPASEKPKPEIKIKHSMVLSDEVINSFVYIPKGDVVEAAPAPLTSALNMDDYTIGLYKVSPDLNTDHLWAYLSGIDNFSKAEEIGSFFKKEAELKGAYKSAYDAIIDSSVKLILERKLPAEDAVTDELLMDKFGISKDFINILEALNLVVRTDENFLIVLSPLIRNFFNFKTKTETFYATTMKNFMPD